MRGKNQEENKRINKNLILKLLITRRNISRIALAEQTGLTKMAVTNIVGELISEGTVIENGSGDAALGRKPILLEIVPGKRLILGLYIARRHIESFAGDFTGRVWNLHRVALKNETRASFEKKLREAFLHQFDKFGDKAEAVGISSIGPLDRRNEILLNPPNFFGIENVNIHALLHEYNLPVYMDNDMNTAAVAEQYFGKAQNIDNFIYIGVTDGIGSGIITNGKLYAGGSGYSGEIGHITVDACGRTCSCGNIGCLELYVPPIREWNDAALPGIYNYLGAALTTVSNLFDPQAIYLGHDISGIEGVQTALGDILSRRSITSKYKKISVELSAFGTQSPVYGAIACAIDRILGE